MRDLLHGIGVSAGVAIGPLHRLAPPPALPPARRVPAESVAAESDRAVLALAAVSADLVRRSAAAGKPAVAEILAAQAMMVDDPVLHDAVVAAVRSGDDPAHAIHRAFAAHRDAFLAAGGYLAERVADLDDLRDRAVAVLIGAAMPGVPQPGHPYVLAARDLAPADTAALDAGQVLALVTEAGGPTAHTAIVARALGIPAVVRCPGVLDLPDGLPVAVDGGSGDVHPDPDPTTTQRLRAEEEARRIRYAGSAGPGRTADGHGVALMANIGSAADLTTDGEGVGLFRTELLYLDRSTPVTVDEQVAAYAAVFEAAAGRRTVIRTLDAGADKPIPFLHQAAEPNPALGIRGVRVGWQRPEVLRTQLDAIGLAATRTRANVWVMAPMVANAAEAARFAQLCHDAGLSTVGVMVEIPAAALRADDLLAEVDFLSIGTNDLSQYTFAADRQCGDLADLLDPWQPALLDLVSRCGEAGARAGKPVGVCGEAAADPLLAPVLVGLGVTSLSMAPPAMPPVRAALAGLSLDECRRLAADALAAPDATTARSRVDEAMRARAFP